ncbi:BTAD domain-containing putative transcriptional regulator [Streptomyces avicenniae]|uniref:BTAD domain-containing putative transcriptional regulator n=1 Tax=Streptomyces avicenniae TaxID=500153 RepID=UPI00069ABFB2|nr:BTAD domain-containing putative transcriptional regulator [Streptomyces avicenniae]
MRFGVLGPLGVWTADGRPVRVPEAKVRALLAALLVHRERPVSADRLVHDLWGDAVPGRPAGALQNKVWQLRRALEAAEPGGRDLVVSRPPGYQLVVGDDAVDADRFVGLTTRARAADDPAVRAELFASALALWRGPAFADFADAEFTRAAAAGLEERRLSAVEERAEARLALGEHASVAEELHEPVARNPLRERLRAAHIRALGLAGRPDAALSSYTELRERLADELGMDPGPELAALHRAILTQDPSLTTAPTPAPAPAPARGGAPGGLTALVGRAEALRTLHAHLAADRLVTLTGAGGVGKTRLARAAAARAADGFPGGVRLAELAALDATATAETVYETIGAVLGVRDDTAGRPIPPADRVVRALGGRRALLVLDNCEHVVGPVAEVAERLLDAAPALTLLATSQLPLGIPGERLQEVPPLEQPAAVELFVARASAAAPRFALDADTADAVAAVCRRLDGIPLALEMAATRVRALGVREVAARLDDRFPLLATGRRTAPARHRTLRAVIDWSWGLLGERERAVLGRLALHADGCALDMAEAFCATGDVAARDVPDLLARLVDASLVVVADTPDGPRYRLLESVTAYCHERLRESGEFDALRQRHLTRYTALAEQAEPHLRAHGQRTWLRRLDAETANLRAALDTAVRTGAADPALRLVNALAWYWRLRGRTGEAERSLSLALSVTGPRDPALVARATAWRGGIRLLGGGGTDPVTEYRTALEPYAAVDDPAGRARAEWFLGSRLYGVGDLASGVELVNRALETFRSLGDTWGTAAALGTRTFQANLRGDFDALREDGERSLALFRELGDRWGQLQAMVPLQTLAEVVGDYGRAARLYRDGLRMAEDLGLWAEFSFQLSGLGRIALLERDYAKAGELHERARRVAVEQSDRFGEQFAEIGLGLGARREGRLDAAEAHLRSVLDLHRRMGYEPSVPPLILAELGFVAELRGDARAAVALQERGLAAARAGDDPRAVALALEGLAGARLLGGDAARAARLLGEAAATRRSVGTPLPDGERDDVDRISAAATTALGATRFAAEWCAGEGVV